MGKRILVIVNTKPVEAMRVAVGLTLLNDGVRVIATERLGDDPALREQREMLEFVEVPFVELQDPADTARQLAAAVAEADIVYRL